MSYWPYPPPENGWRDAWLLLIGAIIVWYMAALKLGTIWTPKF